MSEENKKNEYSMGFDGNVFDSIPDFDSLENASSVSINKSKPTEKSTVENNTNAESGLPSIIFDGSNTYKEHGRHKKSPAFAIICTILIVATVACSIFSVININNYNKNNVLVDSGDNKAFNEYSELPANFGKVEYPNGILQQLAKCYAINKDVVGWLYIPDTNVNTPVVQSKNNNHYLRNNFYGSYTQYGTTYADHRCQLNKLSKNTVIYGHNMPSGTHFYDVNRYEDIEWYKKHPIIKYCTLNKEYTFIIYTAFYSTVNPKDDGGYVFNYIYPNMSEACFNGYIEQVNQRALYTTGVMLNRNDKIITLSTCNHTYDTLCGQEVDSRLVVVGKLANENENSEIDTSSAKVNKDYRKPQIWYTKKGKKNPYASSRSWVPTNN